MAIFNSFLYVYQRVVIDTVSHASQTWPQFVIEVNEGSTELMTGGYPAW